MLCLVCIMYLAAIVLFCPWLFAFNALSFACYWAFHVLQAFLHNIIHPDSSNFYLISLHQCGLGWPGWSISIHVGTSMNTTLSTKHLLNCFWSSWATLMTFCTTFSHPPASDCFDLPPAEILDRLGIHSSFSCRLVLAPQEQRADLVDGHRVRRAAVQLRDTAVVAVEELDQPWNHLVLLLSVTETTVTAEAHSVWPLLAVYKDLTDEQQRMSIGITTSNHLLYCIITCYIHQGSMYLSLPRLSKLPCPF